MWRRRSRLRKCRSEWPITASTWSSWGRTSSPRISMRKRCAGARSSSRRAYRGSNATARLPAQRVAFRGRWDFESVADAGYKRKEVSRCGQLYHPLRAVFVVERVERLPVRLLRAHELTRICNDLALVSGEISRIRFRADQVDQLFANAVLACKCDLGCPHVFRVALARSRQDCREAEPRLYDRVFANEGDHREQALCERRAVEQHAERAADAAKNFEDGVRGGLVLRSEVGFGRDGR